MVGSFPDERSALMLVCARVRYVTSNEWSTRRYLDMSRLGETVREANRSSPQGRAKTKVRKISGLGAADIFLEIITQPFLGFDGIVPGSSNQATV